jgi:hypothetical protein
MRRTRVNQLQPVDVMTSFEGAMTPELVTAETRYQNDVHDGAFAYVRVLPA